MIVEIGHFALILAFMVSIVQATAPMIGASRGWADWMRVAEPAAALCWALTATSFAALTWAFVNSDFSVKLAAEHSNTLQPLLYRVTGVWGNHEGSLLLWTLILTLYGAMVAAFGGALPPTLKARTLAVQGLIGAAFFAFMLFTSNPFERLPNPPLDGADLNPLLQDPGLAFHPPFLYLGYVGLSMSYSFAVAALIEGRVDAAWARWVRPWTLAAWTALTVGIALGSYWAYYELGWGGWWFWDPVENASFMPWLAATALLHSAIVVEKRDTLKSWTILLAILAFTLSLMGTFIVRSGLLTSVHAFASDPTRGVFVLAMLAAASGGALALYAWRAPQLRAGGVFAPVSRESALVLNNLLLAAAAGVVLLGTLMPMIREYWDGARISVGAPFFELAFTPFMVALAIILPIGAALPWKRGRLGRTARRMAPALALALAAAALVWALQTGRSALGPVGVGLGTWLIAGALAEQLERARLGRAPAAETLRRLRNLPRADWGKALAHAGLGLSFIGVSAVTAWEAELIRTARPGDSLELSGYVFVFDDVRQVPGPNYVARQGVFRVFEGGVETARLTPEKRVYTVQRMPTTEAAIDMGLARDLYVVLGDPQDDGSWAVRIYVKPLVNWIWIGALVMALAGLVSLSDRRYRVGAAARRPAPAAVAGAAE